MTKKNLGCFSVPNGFLSYDADLAPGGCGAAGHEITLIAMRIIISRPLVFETQLPSDLATSLRGVKQISKISVPEIVLTNANCSRCTTGDIGCSICSYE